MRIPNALRLALLAMWMALPGCPKPIGEPGHPGIVDCTVQAVRDHGLALIPRVNDCLVASASWEACLISLIAPAAGITEDVLACVVQSSGRSAAASVEANPKDSLSAIAAERARNFVRTRGYVFAR
jgi:hypothetical protein